MRTQRSIAARLWEKVRKTDTCWLWTAATQRGGYGVVGLGRKGQGQRGAHRVSFELAFGPIPKGMSVLHRCDTPACVRPDHLFLGTQRDNIRDMELKGRANRDGGRKITPADVPVIRAACAREDRESYAKIGRPYGITAGAVRAIMKGYTWAHVKCDAHDDPPSNTGGECRLSSAS